MAFDEYKLNPACIKVNITMAVKPVFISPTSKYLIIIELFNDENFFMDQLALKEFSSSLDEARECYSW